MASLSCGERRSQLLAPGARATRSLSSFRQPTRAIEELVNRQAQLEMIDWVQHGGLPGITDPDVLLDARR
ncbi:MAG: hypothetical protein H0U62_10175 [Actinobacteria bacterium]|nr:hypothetical protein [Actinomycetota bacterium]